ncbi:MAG TPA: DNA-formamidopyrimidine glycosylase family protein [Candidatus Eisenbacteria bacterium]|nr:DNA-formamidopyrimidine glycosylase family protein [Candidatus Eisenbacteria bacterium]
MPELPDVTLYVEQLARRVVGATLERVRVASPNLLRTARPPLGDAEGRGVLGVRRLGKRIVLELEDELFLVFHLMISGRLHWKEERPRAASGRPKPPPRGLSAVLEFSTGTLTLTEASTRKRASLHLVRGESGLAELDPGGIEPLAATLAGFREALVRESHTIKRALTDPRLFKGIGNAYSDEILHRARLSPLALTSKLSGDEVKRVYEATRAVLEEWTARLREQTGDEFPEGVTAFRPEMAVHGRYKKPCPVCGSPVQRIVYAENETNYCARCQTGGRLLADRSLSRLLHQDWPRTLEEWEEGRSHS